MLNFLLAKIIKANLNISYYLQKINLIKRTNMMAIEFFVINYKKNK